MRLLTAVATAAAALFPVAAPAQAQAYYVAVPVQPGTKPMLMTHDTVWSLRSGAYVANRAPERDVVLCDLVARSTGKLASFSVAGKAVDADALAKCNARAK